MSRSLPADDDLERVASNVAREHERRVVVRIARLLTDRSPPPKHLFPAYPSLRHELVTAAVDDDRDRFEQALLDVYAHLHMHAADYTHSERQRVNATGGYWAHAGGLSPIVKAGEWLTPDSVSLDLGAGNGLQGLLMQALHPHRLTVQIEISSRMVAIGRVLQRWLEIPPRRIAWAVADVVDVRVRGIDLVYLYRPLKPDTEIGAAFYRRLASDLVAQPEAVTVLSVADCLRALLPVDFEIRSDDGQLICLHRPAKRCR